MEAHLRAGIAIYNAGYYHAAHDAWEDHWLDLDSGADKDFLQGLIQFTAAVYHTTNDNWVGAGKLATTAQGYLDGLGDRYHAVDLVAIRRYLAALERDPQRVGSASPPSIAHDGRTLDFDDLELPATGVAAVVLAEELGYDEDAFEQAVAYARADLAAGEETSPFLTLVFDFVRGADDHRGIVAQRLGEHVDRRQRREGDVDGLF